MSLNPDYGNVLEGPFFLDFFVKDSLYMFRNVTKHHGNMALPISTFAKEMCRKYIYTFRPVSLQGHTLLPSHFHNFNP